MILFSVETKTGSESEFRGRINRVTRVSEGSSEYDVHVSEKMISSRHLFTFDSSVNFRKELFSFTRAYRVLGYHLI